MNELKTIHLLKILLVCLIGFTGNLAYGQSSMPEILDTGTIQEQFDYLDERTRIYNNFRAIREDMFQKIRSNTIDSLTEEKNKVIELNGLLHDQHNLNDSLQTELKSTNDDLDLAVKSRDSLTFLGIHMQKARYNIILWTIIAALAFITGVLFLSSKRVFATARFTRKDLEESKEEFETYRQQTRERYEQMVVRHDNEMRKMKGR